MNLSLLIPSRNNLEFLKLCYSSIRKSQDRYRYNIEILVLDDKSDKDNTWEWCLETMQTDPNFKAFKNNRKERLGISGGYKFLSQQATQDVIGHFHADMFMVEGTLDEIENVLYNYEEKQISEFGSGSFQERDYLGRVRKKTETNALIGNTYIEIPNKNKVVCLTRIEPPIYNEPGLYPEKIIWQDAPIEIEDWNEQKFLVFLPTAKKMWNGKITAGHFVPFFMFREEYLKLGGVDSDNYKFQAREDSDHAFRMVLAGYETIQIPTFVYHFASRGNRRAKDNSGTWKDSPEWQEIDRISTRNFIRKWGSFHPLHDEFLKPRRPNKFNIGFKIVNCSLDLLYLLEPWCDVLINDCHLDDIAKYCKQEQPNTKFIIESRIAPELSDPDEWKEPEIWVEIDGQRFGQQEWDYIRNLSEIINQSGEIGEFELGNLKIKISAMNHYENDLIVCKNEPINFE